MLFTKHCLVVKRTFGGRNMGAGVSVLVGYAQQFGFVVQEQFQDFGVVRLGSQMEWSLKIL